MKLKVKHTLLIVLMILQPILWWSIYLSLYNVAKVKINETSGLAVCCIVSAIISIVVILAYLDSDIEDKK